MAKVVRNRYKWRATFALEAIMARAASDDGLDKFQRYRAARRASGMKLLRVWVPDPNAPGFRAEAARQARLLRDTPENKEALDFIEAALHDLDW